MNRNLYSLCNLLMSVYLGHISFLYGFLESNELHLLRLSHGQLGGELQVKACNTKNTYPTYNWVA